MNSFLGHSGVMLLPTKLRPRSDISWFGFVRVPICQIIYSLVCLKTSVDNKFAPEYDYYILTISIFVAQATSVTIGMESSFNSSPLVPNICVSELGQHWFR